jgi:hypothetical protein
MKKLLSILLSIVFLHSQTAPLYAIHGPIDGSDNQQNFDIVGTYSGTLNPDDPTDAGTPSLDDSGTINSLGLFSLGMPATGPGTGSFVIFTQGIQFTGTITAVGDPGRGTIQGIVEAFYDFTDFVRDAAGNILVDNMGQPITADFTATIRGVLAAQVSQSANTNPTDLASLVFNFARIEGHAEMGIVFQGVTNHVLNFSVDGVKQSATVGAAGALGGGTTP